MAAVHLEHMLWAQTKEEEEEATVLLPIIVTLAYINDPHFIIKTSCIHIVIIV